MDSSGKSTRGKKMCKVGDHKSVLGTSMIRARLDLYKTIPFKAYQIASAAKLRLEPRI